MNFILQEVKILARTFRDKDIYNKQNKLRKSKEKVSSLPDIRIGDTVTTIAPQDKHKAREIYLVRGKNKEKGRPKGQKGDPGGRGEKCHGADATPSVIDLASPQSLDRKICVLGGSNLRHVGDGLGLCSPGILGRAFGVRNSLWKSIRAALLSVCNTDILSSAKKSGIPTFSTL